MFRRPRQVSLICQECGSISLKRDVDGLFNCLSCGGRFEIVKKVSMSELVKENREKCRDCSEGSYFKCVECNVYKEFNEKLRSGIITI